VSERHYLVLTEHLVRCLADLLAEASQTASEGDQFGSPGFRKRANGLRGATLIFADSLPASVALTVADEVRTWCGTIDADDARSVGLRSLLRHLDPSGSPKISS
jgi:hypothetical protein